MNRRYAFSRPNSTTDRPYSRIWGAKITSMWLVALTMSARLHAEFGLAGMSARAIGPAVAAMTAVAGSRMTTAQVISAEEICPTRAFSLGSVHARAAERASTGTMALVSAPPRASS